jgi:hypothetical protein
MPHDRAPLRGAFSLALAIGWACGGSPRADDGAATTGTSGSTADATDDGAGTSGGDDAASSSPSSDGEPGSTGSDPDGSTTDSGGPAGAPLFFDDFEYPAERGDTDVGAIFTAHGWTYAKAENAAAASGSGWLYTTETASPTAGARVLMLEARPQSGPPPEGFPYSQTDFYLQYGAEDGALGAIPPDVWFQFWMFIVEDRELVSRFHGRNKYLYPSAAIPAFPSTDLRWLFMNGSTGFESSTAEPGNNFLALEAYEADWQGDIEYPTNQHKLFQNLSDQQVVAGEWTLVKLHIDTSGAQGSYEAWIRPAHQPDWTKVAEWIGDVTPQFTWPLAEGAQREGHRALRIPTTVNDVDNWILWDDFAIAQSEASLPQYP